MDQYTIEKEIGKGSYGTVYTCKLKKTNTMYVMKKIPLQNMSERERKAAQLEVSLLKELKHPFIVGYEEKFVQHCCFFFSIALTLWFIVVLWTIMKTCV